MSTLPIIGERSQYWPRGEWYDAHNSAGETTAGTKWASPKGASAAKWHFYFRRGP